MPYCHSLQGHEFGTAGAPARSTISGIRRGRLAGPFSGRRGRVCKFRRRAARARSGRRARADTYWPAARLPARPVARAGASLRALHSARGQARRRMGARLRCQLAFGPTWSHLASTTAKDAIALPRPASRTVHRLPGAQSQELAGSVRIDGVLCDGGACGPPSCAFARLRASISVAWRSLSSPRSAFSAQAPDLGGGGRIASSPAIRPIG